MSNLTDAYLECLHEGKFWDKTKEFVKKHKSKIVAGVGIAAGVAAGVAAKRGYDKHQNSPEKIAARKEEKRKKDLVYNTAKKKYNQRHKDDNNPSNIKAAGYAAKETAKTLAKPVAKVAIGGAKILGRGIAAAGKAIGKAAQRKVNNKIDDYKFERMRKKRTKERVA